MYEDMFKEPSIQDNQKRILISLMHNPLMTFNQLWAKEGRSNKFAYHLKVLVKKELVKKTPKGYSLTTKGKQQVAYLERTTGEQWKFPIVAVIAVITEGEKVLVLQRKKEPFREYWGFHGGKLHATQNLLECAEQAIKEETGLTCDVELKGLLSTRTFQGDDLSYNHQLFVVQATNPTGTLLQETKKGKNRWVTKSDIKDLETLPNIPHLLKIAFGKRFRWVEADRFQENDVFQGITLKRDMVI